MSIKINLGNWNSVFAVPSKIVDEGLKFSDGVKLKVLLYILRNSDKELDEKDISKATGVNVTDIPEAVEYWVSMGVLQNTSGVLSPQNNGDSDSTLLNSENSLNNDNFAEDSKLTPKKIAEDVAQTKKRFAVTKPQKPDYVFTAQRLAVDEELKILVNEAQTALSKTLSNSDVSTLLMLKDTCGLPLDVILMLIQYCISIDKGNMRTIQNKGIAWADEGITSVEAAEEKIRSLKQTSINFSIVSSTFGIKNPGSPTPKQYKYADKWVGEWNFSPEILREAYDRCVDAKGTMNFSYIDGILKRWHANGVKTTEDIKKLDIKPKESKISSSKRSYDIDELEKINLLEDF